MPVDRDPAIIIDIANACELIRSFLKDKAKSDLESDLLLQSAVLHQLLVLGEAIRRLSDGAKATHGEIDWRGYIGLRNILIHQYDAVDLDQIWMVATNDIPLLLQTIGGG